MSWMKRAPGAPPPASDQPFAAAQPFGGQQNMYPTYQGGMPPQQQYWSGGAPPAPPSAPAPPYNQQYGQQVFQQQDYGNNANQFYQQPAQYDQNYSNQSYNSMQQQNYPQNYYPNQMGHSGQPQNVAQNKGNDGWEDNWDWGWEESKQGQKAPRPDPAPAQALPLQQPVFNNANVIEESFATTDSWNWAMEERKGQEAAVTHTPDNKEVAPISEENKVEAPPVENTSQLKVNSQKSHIHTSSEEVRDLSDRDAIKERLPNLALGKRFHLDNLTPQWSIESQMSQESSDGPHTHSEGTYRSDNQSRNSSKSSPGLNTETNNFNFPQSVVEEPYLQNRGRSRNSIEDNTLIESRSDRKSGYNELANSMQDMNLEHENRSSPLENDDSSHISFGSHPAPPASPPASPAPDRAAILPPPPPAGFPSSSSGTNPFKQSGSFSHKSSRPSSQGAPGFSPQPGGPGLAAVHPPGFGANLETTPDNSERPDRPPAAPRRAPSPLPPDNLEAPSERERFLCGEPAEPPPGLTRLVLGRPGPAPRRQADGRARPLERVVPGGACGERAGPASAFGERDLTVEGENLQDLGAPEPVYAREPGSGAAPGPSPPEPRADRARGGSTGDESERFRASPRRERHKSPRDRERDKEGRYSRGDRKYERGSERRSTREDRRERRDASPDARRPPRGSRRRYDTEDTDYYSDRERERRRYREGSHKASKPPRPDDKDRSRRYHTVERDKRRDERDERRRERDYPAYRDIDPARTFASLRRDDRHRRDEAYSPARADSLAAVTDDDPAERRRRHRPPHDPYYDGYGYADPYAAHYQYYEQLRRRDPAAYLQVYQELMAGRAPPAPRTRAPLYDGYGYEVRDGRASASLHSGRSSGTGLKGAEELTTDASLNLQLEESVTRSERMTPCKFSTAHVKGSLSSRNMVVVYGAYPVDGRPARVAVLALSGLLRHEPSALQLRRYPGPLARDVTHKKSVIEYCGERVRAADAEGGSDCVGHALLWRLLAQLVTQNGVIVGTDIAELLMTNQQQYELAPPSQVAKHHGSSRASSVSPGGRSASPDNAAEGEAAPAPGADAEARLRDLLLCGDRQEAIEWAISNQLWGHAMLLSAHSERRVRAHVQARFLCALPPADPLHTLHAALQAARPPAATCAGDAHWGDWRPHAAILLANCSRDQARRNLIQLGDSLASRGLLYSAQFCYLSAGVSFSRHPLAPLSPPPAPPAPAAPPAPPAPPPAPRLSLLLADPRAHTLAQFATNYAIFATEIYEYALSLNQDYEIPELQVYKLILATRLADVGEYERALAYCERIAVRQTPANPHACPALCASVASLAARLRLAEPALADEAGSSPPSEHSSPRHPQWLADVTAMAQQEPPAPPAHDAYAGDHYQQWEQTQQTQYLQQEATPPAPLPEVPAPAPEVNDYPQFYSPDSLPVQQPLAQPLQQPLQQPLLQPLQPANDEQQYDDWQRNEDRSQYDNYWSNDSHYGYGEAAAESTPNITMPGERRPDRPPSSDRPPSEHQSNETDTPKTTKKEGKSDEKGEKGKTGWLGGLLTKLTLRPPNQMILPDDSNPSIVWDPETKRWRDVDAGVEPAPAPPPPPPTGLPASGVYPSSASPPAPLPPPGSNIFKMQKSRHIKKSYVDVLNPGGPRAAAPPPAPLASPAYFVPQATPLQGEYDPQGGNGTQYSGT